VAVGAVLTGEDRGCSLRCLASAANLAAARFSLFFSSNDFSADDLFVFPYRRATSPAVRAFLRARAASSADLAAELVISNNAASKFRMRSAAADNLFPLVFLEDDEGDLDAMAVADRVGESDAVIFVSYGVNC